jgi:hypothetical protein
MTDENTKPGKFNTVTHSKDDWWCPLVDVTAIGTLSPADASRVVSNVSIGAAVSCSSNIGSVIPVTDATLEAECIAQMHPRRIKTGGFDLSLELGEMLETYQSVIDLDDGIKAIAKRWDEANAINSPVVRRLLRRKAFESWSIKDWANIAVSLDLGYKFGVKPVTQLIQKWKSAEDRWYSLLKRVTSEEVTLHGRSSRTGSSSYAGNNYGNTVHQRIDYGTTVLIKYSSPMTESLAAELKRRHFGAVPRLATAYELTSLSFVLDWFWNLGKYLQRWAETPIEGITYEVLQSGYTRKSVTEIQGYVTPFASTDDVWYRAVQAPPLVTGWRVQTTFVRQAKSFDLEGGGIDPAPTFKLPNAGQLLTLIELIYTLRSASNTLIRLAK